MSNETKVAFEAFCERNGGVPVASCNKYDAYVLFEAGRESVDSHPVTIKINENLRNACRKLVGYRARTDPLTFQFEKAVDYIRDIEEALALADAVSNQPATTAASPLCSWCRKPLTGCAVLYGIHAECAKQKSFGRLWKEDILEHAP